jgi:hypothetical protein
MTEPRFWLWHASCIGYTNISHVLEIGSGISSIADADYQLEWLYHKNTSQHSLHLYDYEICFTMNILIFSCARMYWQRGEKESGKEASLAGPPHTLPLDVEQWTVS